MTINSYLRKNGYRPELSDGIYDKYEKAIASYLKETNYNEFCDLREYASCEEEILDFIGDDERFLKIVFSAQIQISICILEKIISVIKNRPESPNQILDLGGADGWAINYLNESLNLKCPLTVVDLNNRWNLVNDNITLVNKTYSEFKNETKFDLIISILGASNDNLIELFTCIKHSISNKGMALVGLRIASDYQYTKALEIADSLGLRITPDLSSKLKIFDEQIPFIALERSTTKLKQSEKLNLIRQGFHNNLEAKRVYGFEARCLLQLIEDGERMAISKETWYDGEYFEVKILNKNDILYRISQNNSGDLLIEYPIEIQDEKNEVGNQLSRMTLNDIWNNSL